MRNKIIKNTIIPLTGITAISLPFLGVLSAGASGSFGSLTNNGTDKYQGTYQQFNNIKFQNAWHHASDTDFGFNAATNHDDVNNYEYSQLQTERRLAMEGVTFNPSEIKTPYLENKVLIEEIIDKENNNYSYAVSKSNKRKWRITFNNYFSPRQSDIRNTNEENRNQDADKAKWFAPNTYNDNRMGIILTKDLKIVDNTFRATLLFRDKLYKEVELNASQTHIRGRTYKFINNGNQFYAYNGNKITRPKVRGNFNVNLIKSKDYNSNILIQEEVKLNRSFTQDWDYKDWNNSNSGLDHAAFKDQISLGNFRYFTLIKKERENYHNTLQKINNIWYTHNDTTFSNGAVTYGQSVESLFTGLAAPNNGLDFMSVDNWNKNDANGKKVSATANYAFSQPSAQEKFKAESSKLNDWQEKATPNYATTGSTVDSNNVIQTINGITTEVSNAINEMKNTAWQADNSVLKVNTTPEQYITKMFEKVDSDLSQFSEEFKRVAKSVILKQPSREKANQYLQNLLDINESLIKIKADYEKFKNVPTDSMYSALEDNEANSEWVYFKEKIEQAKNFIENFDSNNNIDASFENVALKANESRNEASNLEEGYSTLDHDIDTAKAEIDKLASLTPQERETYKNQLDKVLTSFNPNYRVLENYPQRKFEISKILAKAKFANLLKGLSPITRDTFFIYNPKKTNQSFTYASKMQEAFDNALNGVVSSNAEDASNVFEQFKKKLKHLQQLS
ncbi:hypothetical protein [Mycoplasma nasistruthionis]|uniref:Uncharacterized protein n=1 Tax=Mycoplasma nasistruthionis TaxID=353852 RepID=A0A5B7XUX5_9MOLU|nr:hypothetical protein [Mycoplasma nasistruthionis]QCZ36512.1 hypothetical protein FG904_00550 [Mycoplasma nasistruthionis]